MGSKALKGLTIEIGADTSELTKALDSVDKKSRKLSSELGEINRALKLDPSNTELLAQKQKVLAEAISNTEGRLDTLKEAEKQVQKQFERGEVSEEQVRALRREIIETERKLDGYKNAAKETAEAEEKLAKGADKAGDELDEQADSAKKAGKASEELDDDAGDLAAGGLAAVAAAATAAVTAIVALAEESREYRVAMGKLNTAFQDSSLSAEAATKTYEALQGVLGETDQAVEASSLLAKMCKSEEELTDWTEILTGVYGVFGASLPVEGLAEAANETMRVGQVTGPLADALNWAAQEGETFGVTLKKNTKANEDWNNAVKEAASAEDYFNLALQECSNEQERQQLITSTLTRLYGGAAKEYKKTNKEVIRANEATEKWNKATAKVGKAVEPVVTDIKELGVTLLEDASEPLEDIAEFIRKDVIPAIEKTSKWVKKNGPMIKAVLVAVVTSMIAFKVATVAATVSQVGLAAALKKTAIAQKALAIAQSLSPWGWLAVGVTAVVAGIAAYTAATKKAVEPVDVLTKEERELMAAADEAAEAFRDQKKATDEALGDVTAHMTNVQSLADELRDLASASGKVKEKDRERANFILNELNEALGTEYKMVDGVIQKYKDLKKNIDEVIQSKLANSLLEAANDDYVAAVERESEALENANLKKKDYQQQLAITQQKEAEYLKAKQDYELRIANAVLESDYILAEGQLRAAEEKKAAWETEKAELDKKKTEYEKAAYDYGVYQDTINTYVAAQTAALSGNYQTTVDLLSRKGDAYGQFAGTVDDETAKVLNTLYKEAIDAGLNAELTRENFEKGVANYTEEMVKEAETNYAKAMGEFENAYSDAHAFGTDLSAGMTDGAESKRPNLIAKARSLVKSFLAAARDEADTHSPSKKTIKIFEDIGQGGVVGTENKTKDLKKAATKQMAAVLDAYGSPEVTGQKVFRSIAEKQTARQTTLQTVAATANGAMLEQILAAIKEGQVLMLDGTAVVGGTVGKMDSKLGQLRALAARGAR